MTLSPTELRLQLRAAGFDPLPAEGKAVVAKAWPTKIAVGNEEIESWPRFFPLAENTGILTRLAPTLDIDIHDPAAAEAVENLVRERFADCGYVLTRFGQPPKRAIPFRTLQPFAKISANLIAPNGSTGGDKLELLCNGQQVIVDGIHPTTGMRYEWFGGKLGEIKLEQLPYISAEAAAALVADAVDLLVTQHSYTLPHQEKKSAAGAKNGFDPQQQQAGHDWGELLANIQQGHELHDSLVSLASKLVIAGMSGGAATNFLRAMLEQSETPRGARFNDRMAEIAAAVRSAQDKLGNSNSITTTLTLHWHGEESATALRYWLVEGLLPEIGTGLVSGQWGTYKTFVTLDLAAGVMVGAGSFIGFPVRRRGGVLFIAAEGSSDITPRLQAVLADKYPGKGRMPFTWTDNCPRLADPDAVKVLVETARQADERMRAEFGVPLALIAIDTLATSSGFTKAGDENDAAMAAGIMTALATVSRATGTLVLGVDHFGKDVTTGTRGSSAKEAAADVVLALLGDKAVSGEVTNTRLAVRKNRAGPSGQEFAFGVRVVELAPPGRAAAGTGTTSLVIDWQHQPAAAGARKEDDGRWSKSLRLLRQCLMSVLATDAARDLRPFPDGPSVRAIDLEVLRSEFYRSYAADGDADAKRAARRQAFHRSIKGAQDRGVICIRDDLEGATFIWLARREDEP